MSDNINIDSAVTSIKTLTVYLDVQHAATTANPGKEWHHVSNWYWVALGVGNKQTSESSSYPPSTTFSASILILAWTFSSSTHRVSHSIEKSINNTTPFTVRTSGIIIVVGHLAQG